MIGKISKEPHRSRENLKNIIRKKLQRLKESQEDIKWRSKNGARD